MELDKLVGLKKNEAIKILHNNGYTKIEEVPVLSKQVGFCDQIICNAKLVGDEVKLYYSEFKIEL